MEFKDTEEELPVEEFSNTLSDPSPDSLPAHPQPPLISDENVRDASSLDQNTSISSDNLSEQGVTENATTSPSESHNILFTEHNIAISSSKALGTFHENSRNLSSESNPLPHSSPDQTSHSLEKKSEETGNAPTSSTTVSSEMQGISSQSPISQDNSSISGTTTQNPAIISHEVHGSLTTHSLSEPGSLVSPDIPEDLETTKNAMSPPTEDHRFPNSNETNTVSENSASLSSEVHDQNGASSFNSVEVQSNNDHTAVGELKKTENGSDFELNKHEVEVRSTQSEATGLANASGHAKQATINRGLVDTTAPFESVKEAVSWFGGIVDWKAHRAQALERRKQVQLELEKVQEEIPNYERQSEAAEDAKEQVLTELDSTKRLIEELKLNLEKAQTEEAQAKQDSELAQLRAREMEQGIADEASVAAKAQVEVARERHEAAVVELKSVRKELEELQKEYISLLNDRDAATQKAEEAVLASKEIEKTVEDLTLELMATKETLEAAHAAHLEAEEHRIGAALARDQDYLNWERELKQAAEDLQKLNEQLLSTKVLKEKLEESLSQLHNLKAELAAYMESKLIQESGSNNEDGTGIQQVQKELEEVKVNIEKVKNEVNILRAAESSLKLELQREKAGLENMRQREGMASIAVSSVEAEIERTKEEIKLAFAHEKEARGKMIELPKLLQQAAQEAELAKADAQSARDELKKTREDAEQIDSMASMTEIRLNAAMKEIEAAKASQNLALLAIKALQGSEGEELGGGVTLTLEEYYSLSKIAHEAEEMSNERVTAAVAQINVAKESELKTLQRLEEVYKELKGKKDALRVAMETSERAQEGKLGVEQELRKWRAEHEQTRRASMAAAQKASANPPKSPNRSLENEPKSFVKDAEVYTAEKKPENNVHELKGRRKKKKSLIPRIIMFLARKKAETL